MVKEDTGVRNLETRPAEEVERLVVEALDLLETEGPAALETLCARHPEQASAMRRRVQQLHRLGFLEGAGISPEEMPERLDEFKIERRLGGGGMGVVYLARQEPLGREVALKLIRPDQLFQPGLRERFAREVQAVARLQHPGIVPIYTVGQASGLPYFTMERVPGCTLDEALEPLVSKRPGDLAGTELARSVADASARALGGSPPETADWLYGGTWEQVCLRIVRAVAEGLEHVHARGVLHRDLKPSNIMVTPGGRVMLVDFGLASHTGAESLTRSSAHLGSLPYLPPERIDGGSAADDPRGDVYSLGVTLYQMLCLRLPYVADSHPATMLAIARGAPPKPRSLNPALSWEAETVCLAAMERDPARRYASAADFARDLSNALERRPIEARRAGVWLRTRRWAERNPARAVTLALGSLIVLGAPSAYAWQQHRALRKINAALELAREQKTRAEKNRDHVIAAVDKLFLRVSQFDLASMPRMEPLRKALNEDALAIYQGLMDQEGSDPTLRFEKAGAHVQAARFLTELGRHEEALTTARGGLGLLEPELGAAGGSREARMNLARLRTAAGTALLKLGKLAECRAEIAPAVEDARALAREESLDGELALLAADALTLHSNASDRLGDSEGALAAAREARQILETTARSDAPQRETLLAFVEASNQLGHYLANVPKVPPSRAIEAERVLRETIELLESHLGEGLDDDPIASARVSVMANLAELIGRLGRGDESFELFERCVQDSARLVERFPSTLPYRGQLGQAYSNRAVALLLLGRELEAETSMEDGARELETLSQQMPGVPDVLSDLGVTEANLGQFALRSGEAAKSRRQFEKAIGRQRQALELSPSNAGYKSRLADHLYWLHDLLRDAGELQAAADAVQERPRLLPDDWLPCWNAAEAIGDLAARVPSGAPDRAQQLEDFAQRAVHELRELQARGCPHAESKLRGPSLAPLRSAACFQALLEDTHQRCNERVERASELARSSPSAESREALGQAYIARAEVLLALERGPEALTDLEAAADTLERLSQEAPDHARALSTLADTEETIGAQAWADKDLARARRSYERAVEHQRRAIELDPDQIPYSEHLAAHLYLLSDVLFVQGEFAASAEAMEERAALRRYDWMPCKDAAVRLSELAARVPAEAPDRDAQVRDFAARAVAQLRELRRRACPAFEEELGDRKLDALRSTEPFRELLAELAAEDEH